MAMKSEVQNCSSSKW